MRTGKHGGLRVKLHCARRLWMAKEIMKRIPFKRLLVLNVGVVCLLAYYWFYFHMKDVDNVELAVNIGKELEGAGNIVEYYPQSRGDASVITWARASNTKEKLENIVKPDVSGEKEVMVIEGDVSTLVPSQPGGPPTPIMKGTQYKFKDWLDQALKTRRAIQLDFKDMNAVLQCLQIIKSRSPEKLPPLWFHADIVKLNALPSSIENAIDGRKFLDTVSESFPRNTLSLGWKSLPGSLLTWKDTIEMYQAVLSMGYVRQPVVFTVHSSMLQQATSMLLWLCELTDAQLSIFGGPGETVPMIDLLYLRHKLNFASMYLDLPRNVMIDVLTYKNEPLSFLNNHMTIENELFQVNSWRGMCHSDKERNEVYVTPTAVVARGPKCFQLAMDDSLHISDSHSAVTLSTRFQFVPYYNADKPNTTQEFQILINAEMLDEMVMVPSILCSLDMAGQLRVKYKDTSTKGKVALSATNCYTIHVTYRKYNVKMTVHSEKHCDKVDFESDNQNTAVLHMDTPDDGKQDNTYRYPLAVGTTSSDVFVVMEKLLSSVEQLNKAVST